MSLTKQVSRKTIQLQAAPEKDPSGEWFAPQMTMVIHYVETREAAARAYPKRGY